MAMGRHIIIQQGPKLSKGEGSCLENIARHNEWWLYAGIYIMSFRSICSKYGFYLIMSEGIIDLHHIIVLLV